MFCPNCRSEYIDGVRECDDCHVALVMELPPKHAPPETDDDDEATFELLLSTKNEADIAFVRSILDESGIVYFIQNELFNHFFWGSEPARVMVNAAQLEDAQKLLEKFDPHFFRFSIPKQGDDEQEPT